MTFRWIANKSNPKSKPSMIHGLKVSLAKGTTKKKIIKGDESLSATAATLYQWRVSMEALLACIVQNEKAWDSLFQTYSSFDSVGASIYPQRDAPVLTLLKDLQAAKSRVESPPPNSVEPNFNATQRIQLSKKELAEVVSRINETSKLHEKRVDAIRQHKYYDSKTNQMLHSEAKRRSPISQKDLERRSRNQTKVKELALQLTDFKRRIQTEMESLEVERLAVTDRALSAMLLLQKHYYESYPVRSTIAKADEIGLGHRILLRPESRPWAPDLISNPSMSNARLSLTPPPHHPPYDPIGSYMQFSGMPSSPSAPPLDFPGSDYGTSYASTPTSPTALRPSAPPLPSLYTSHNNSTPHASYGMQMSSQSPNAYSLASSPPATESQLSTGCFTLPPSAPTPPISTANYQYTSSNTSNPQVQTPPVQLPSDYASGKISLPSYPLPASSDSSSPLMNPAS